ncbi:hypothetical protein PIB30_016498 [Stylosanthes scabra]|uniref:Uncharacterized protein n=1 Tax=Stylosanthes scabra TaxID=79078 RepID=A0ABU6Z462_9FABA|nr:hypothetical protein [Stylosanthes scabra]
MPPRRRHPWRTAWCVHLLPVEEEREGAVPPCLVAAAPCRRCSSTGSQFRAPPPLSPPPPFTAVVPCPLCTSRPPLLTAGVGTAAENEEPNGDTKEEEFIDDDISSSESEDEPILPDSD